VIKQIGHRVLPLVKTGAGKAARSSFKHAALVSAPIILIYLLLFCAAGWALYYYGFAQAQLRPAHKIALGVLTVGGYLLAGLFLGTLDAAATALNAMVRTVEEFVAAVFNAALKSVQKQLSKLGNQPSAAELTAAIKRGLGDTAAGISAGQATGILFTAALALVLGVVRSVLLARAGTLAGKGVFRAAALFGNRITLFLSVMAGVKLRLMAIRLAVRGAALILLAAAWAAVQVALHTFVY